MFERDKERTETRKTLEILNFIQNLKNKNSPVAKTIPNDSPGFRFSCTVVKNCP